MGFSRQKYCSGLSCPPAGDLHNPGIEPISLMSPALAGGFFFTTSTTWEAHALTTRSINSQKQQLKQKAAQTLRRSTGGTQVGISLGRIRRDFVIAVAIFQDWEYYMMLYGPWRELKSACSVKFQERGKVGSCEA